MNIPQMYQYWQPHRTSRTFAIGAAEDGSIWFGCAADTLFHHDPASGHTEAIHVPALAGRPLSQCVCLDGYVYILMQASGELLRYEMDSGATTTIPLPAGCNVWYGTAIARRHLLVAVDRAGKRILMLESGSESVQVYSATTST